MSNYTQMVKVPPLAGIIALFMFLSLVYPCVGETGQETVVVFKGSTTEVSSNKGSAEKNKQTPHGFRIPAFVGGVVNDKEFLAVFCKGHYDRTSNLPFTSLATRRSYENFTKWSDAEQFPKTTDVNKKTTNINYVTAVMKGDKIYALETSSDKSNAVSTGSGASTTRREPFMYIGTVKPSGGSGIDDGIVTWEEKKPLKNLIKANEDSSPVGYFFGGIGNGVVMKNGTIVLPVQIVKTDETSAASIIYSSDNGTTWHIGEETQLKTFAGSVVEWGNGKLLFFVRFSGRFCDVYETDDMGTTWKRSPLLSGVWPKQPNLFGPGSQGSVITAPIDKEDVLIFSHPLNNNGGNIIKTLQLWLSDGHRVKCVGNISDKNKGDHYGSSILANVGDHLYVAHEINPFSPVGSTSTKSGEWDRVIALSLLTKLFDSSKSTVREWKKLDALLETKGVPINDLVGLLGNTETEDNSVWTDKYKCVNAIVKNGQPVVGGFRFSGAAGSGAQWPVSSQGQNQVYAFTKKQFTLAATVTIHTAEGKGTGKFVLLGASLSLPENNVFIGLGYTEENKWYAESHGNTEIATTGKFESGKEYHIAITFADEKAVVYVDGEDITKEEITITAATSISHFFMGGAGQSSSAATDNSCTVKNVMLFSRALGKEEMKKLSDVSKDANLHTPIPAETPKSEPEISSTALTTNAQSAQHLHKTDSKVEVKSVPEIPDAKKNMKPTRLPDGSQSLSTKKTQQTSVTNKQEIIKEITKGKVVEHALRNHPNGTHEKHLQGADTAAVSFGIMPFMCFVCSVIVLAGL